MPRMLPESEAEPGGTGAPDETITLPRSEYEALRARATEPAGDTAEELAARERRLLDRERSFRDAVRDRELAVALAGKPLVGGAAEQLIKLWRDEFDVCEEDGRFRVVSRDGGPVARAIADRLARPEYAHFCLPTSRGGTASREVARGTGSPAPAPRTLGEAAIARWREAAGAGGASAPIGLGRRR